MIPDFSAFTLGTSTWDDVAAHPDLAEIFDGKAVNAFAYEQAGGSAVNTRLAYVAIAAALGYDASVFMCTKFGNSGPRNPYKDRVIEEVGDHDLMDGAYFQDHIVSKCRILLWGKDAGGVRRFISKIFNDLHTPFYPNIENEIVEAVRRSRVAILHSRYPSLALTAAFAARERGIPVILDFSETDPSLAARMEPVLKLADYILAPAEASLPGAGVLAPADLLDGLVRLYGCRYAAVSDNSHPVQAWNDGECFQISVEKGKSVDNLGAGDVRDAALGFFTVRGDGFKPALEKATSIASFSARFPGRDWIEPLAGYLRAHPLFANDFAPDAVSEVALPAAEIA